MEFPTVASKVKIGFRFVHDRQRKRSIVDAGLSTEDGALQIGDWKLGFPGFAYTLKLKEGSHRKSKDDLHDEFFRQKRQ